MIFWELWGIGDIYLPKPSKKDCLLKKINEYSEIDGDRKQNLKAG